MNKIILQLGLLSFCVAAVYFHSLHLSLMDTISRAFILFIGVVALTTLVAGLVNLFARSHEEKDIGDESQAGKKREYGNDAHHPRSATHGVK
jgi:hypothetical protein